MEQFKPKIKLISASAGTGKTYTLVQEISRVLQTTAPEKIVAITFARSATRDIRNRIKVDDINISTIHGFFAGILREQAIFFRHSANFTILDEFDDKKIFRTVASELMLKKAQEGSYEDLFVLYDIGNVIEMFQKLEGHYAAVREKLNFSVEELFEQERKAEYRKLKELIPDDVKDSILDPILNLKGKSGDKVEELRRSIVPFIGEITPVKDLASFYKDISILRGLEISSPGSSGSVKNWDSPEELSRIKTAIKRLSDIKKQCTDKYRIGDEWIAKEAAKNRKLFFDLFLLVHSAYEKRKRELDVLSYNDIELLTHDLVVKNDKVAAFYRDKYEHIFVDEFQDTNTMQRDVLFAIAKELFLVGDAKQSIYRFRNADVRVFIDTQSHCAKDELEELLCNRRCLPNIIDTVNFAFSKIFAHSHSAERKDFEADYLEFRSGRDDAGAGIVRFINAENHSIEAEISYDLIRKGLEQGRSYKDFALLFRNSNHMVEFERLFREKGLPFIVYGGSSRKDLLSSLRSLFNVILDPYDDHSMLEVLKLPNFYMDDKDIYELKREHTSIWEGLGDGALKELILDMRRIKDHGSFTEFVAEVLRRSKFILSASLIFTGQDTGAEEAILGAARHVESEGEGIEYFLEYIYSVKSDEVGVDIDAVKLMTVHSSKGLEFNCVIIPCLDSPPRPAKDIVVISDDGEVAVKLGEEDSVKKFNTVLYHNIKDYEAEADIAESKRLLYVAMTRARDELYLVGDLENGKGLEKPRWVDWLSEVFKDRVEQYPISLDEKELILKRKVVRAVSDGASLVTNTTSLPRRLTVSSIRAFVYGFDKVHSLDDSKENEASSTRLGNIIHSILEHWEDKEAVARIYKSIGSISGPVSTIVESFVSSELGQRSLNTESSFVEHSFAVKIDQHVVSGRIDRINVYKDHVWVMDYKTKIDENELEGYKAQLACYLCFAERYFKDKKIIGSIIDVTGGKEYTYDITVLKPWIKEVVKELASAASA